MECCPWCGNMTSNPLGFCSEACYTNHAVESAEDSLTMQQINEMEDEWQTAQPRVNGKRVR